MPLPTTLAASNPLLHVIDHAIVKYGDWYVLTNHMVMMVLAAALMLLIFPALTARYRSGEMVPTGTRNFFEAMLLFIRNDVAKPVLGEETDKFIPFLWTLFFFILFNNLLGLLPLEPLTADLSGLLGLPHAVYGTATANLYVTGALALVAWAVIQIAGIRAHGFGNYARHFLGGAPIYMAPIMVPVEIMGMLVKPVALAIRLFANMTAGHLLVAVLIGFSGAAASLGLGAMIGIGIPVVLGTTAIMVLELFVAFLQAYLFTFLTALFIGQLVAHEDHGEHAHDEYGHEVGEGVGHVPGESLGDAPRHAGAHMAG